MLSVAPEGTLSHGRCVLKFKTGAFVAGMPVVPFVLRYKLTPHNPAWTIIIPFWHVVSFLHNTLPSNAATVAAAAATV
jgi:lysophosphatidylcholine acyltransferase/lyso-PAF acetyltransferase